MSRHTLSKDAQNLVARAEHAAVFVSGIAVAVALSDPLVRLVGAAFALFAVWLTVQTSRTRITEAVTLRADGAPVDPVTWLAVGAYADRPRSEAV